MTDIGIMKLPDTASVLTAKLSVLITITPKYMVVSKNLMTTLKS